MGQMFFNIGQLADFLIADSGAPKNISACPQDIKFEDYIGALLGNKGSQAGKDAGAAAIFADFGQLFANAGELKMAVPQPAIVTVSDDKNALNNPPSIQDLLATLTGNSINQKSVSASAVVAKTPDSAVESLEKSLAEAVTLEGLVASQAIPVTIDLDKVKLDLAKLPIQLKPNNDIDKLSTFNYSKYIESTDLKNQPSLILINSTYGQLNGNSAKSTPELTDFAAIGFTTDQLFNSDDKVVHITAFDTEGKPYDINIKSAVLRQIVDNYQGQIQVEAKSPELQVTSTIKIAGSSENNVGQKPDSEKYVIFDLKSLLQVKGLEMVAIVNKTVNPTDQNSVKTAANNTNFNYLESASLNRKQLIKPIDIDFENMVLKSDSGPTNLAEEIKQIDKKSSRSELKIESGKNSKTESGSDSKTWTIEQRNQSGVSDYNQMTKPNDYPAAGKTPGGGEINISQHLAMKNVASSIDPRNAELMFAGPKGEVNLDAASVIDQLKSRFMLNNGSTRMIIDLKPESLGKIRIDFKYYGDKIEALFKVDNSDIKMLLEGELAKLKNDFKIDSYKVEINANNFSRGADARGHGHPYYAQGREWYRGHRDSIGQANDLESIQDIQLTGNSLSKKPESLVDLFI